MNPIVKEDLQRICAQDIAWDKLKDAAVLVTGASGMVGTYFVRTVLALNETRKMNATVIPLCVIPKRYRKI